MPRPLLLTLTALAASSLVGAAQAQTSAVETPAASEPADNSPAATPTRDEDRLTFRLSPRAEHAFNADLDDSGAGVGVTRAGAGLEVGYAFSPKFIASFGVDVETSWYEFDGDTSLIPGATDPFNDLYRVVISAGGRYAFNERWAAAGGVLVEMAGESDADVGDSTTIGGYAAVQYAFSERFSAGFGLLAAQRLEDSALFVPILSVQWQITDTLTLASDRLGLRLTNRLSDQWSIWLGGRYEIREFRLADDGPLPEGIVGDRRVPIKVGLEWRPTDRITVGLQGGAVVWQEFRIDDRDGNRVNEDNVDPAGLIGLSVEITF